MGDYNEYYDTVNGHSRRTTKEDEEKRIDDGRTRVATLCDLHSPRFIN